MTGPRIPTVHPHRRRARHLLPFLLAIVVSPLACTDEPTAPQSAVEGSPRLRQPGSTRTSRPKAASAGGRPSSSVRAVPVASFARPRDAAAATGPKVLILADVDGASTTALANSLVDAGFHVSAQPAPEYNWFGTNPSLTGYEVVVHLNGVTYNPGQALRPLQTELSAFVQPAVASWARSGTGMKRAMGPRRQMSDLVLHGRRRPGGGELRRELRASSTTASRARRVTPSSRGFRPRSPFHADGHVRRSAGRLHDRPVDAC